jgi:hypothetical protein
MLFVSKNRSNAHRENPYSLNPVKIEIKPPAAWVYMMCEECSGSTSNIFIITSMQQHDNVEVYKKWTVNSNYAAAVLLTVVSRNKLIDTEPNIYMALMLSVDPSSDTPTTTVQ